MIDRFTDKYEFLGNFYDCEITYEGIKYLSSESAYQAQKVAEWEKRKGFALLSPSDAKKAGRNVKLRQDWEEIKLDVMYQICKTKFVQHPELAIKLMQTGNEELIEGNHHGDTYWGMADGVGENYLGRTLMRIRNEIRGFDVAKVTTEIVEWIREYFKNNGSPDTKAVIGISGGKDSTICGALLVLALGGERVLGVLMPQGEQADIDYSRNVVKTLGIDSFEINIEKACNGLMDEIQKSINLTKQAVVNTPARIRMTTLYAVGACVGGRVVNTCNLSEDWVGYSTKFGDNAGDFSILSDLTVTEVLGIGDYLQLPYRLVHKIPIDGLSGKSDEENLGFSYGQLDGYIRGYDSLNDNIPLRDKIDKMHRASRHKVKPMPKYLYK